MDIDFIAHVEQTLDNYRHRIEALEAIVIQSPGVEIESDQSRVPHVKVTPAPLRKP